MNAPPSSPFPFPYQIKNSPFRDKIISCQDVDLHGVVKVGGKELIVRKRNETQSNPRNGRIHRTRGMRHPRMRRGREIAPQSSPRSKIQGFTTYLHNLIFAIIIPAVTDLKPQNPVGSLTISSSPICLGKYSHSLSLPLSL